MGYVKEQIAETNQTVEGGIIALDDDQSYQLSFRLIKN